MLKWFSIPFSSGSHSVRPLHHDLPVLGGPTGMVERSDRMWSTGEGNDKALQYSCLENLMNSMKRQNDRILEEELPRSVGAQYATGDQWRNNSTKNEGMEPKQKQCPVVGVTGDRSKVRCCKEQYCIGTWNVRSLNQGKLEVVKQEILNGLPWKQTDIILSFLRLHPSTAFWTLLTASWEYLQTNPMHSVLISASA